MDILEWLEEWFSDQCDGDWEHGLGIRVETLDNPGWSVFVTLEGTYLESKVFEEVEYDRSETDWLMCRVKEGRFESAGGPRKLKEILQVFRKWAESK